VSEPWTLSDLVAEAATRLEALPPPKNGQVRAVPDERTIRYYATIGLLDRPAAMRGRTALYGRRHLAQVVAIKRMQSTGKSLAEIQALWPTLDEVTLSRMSGMQLVPGKAKGTRKEFWKREAEVDAEAEASPAMPKAYASPTTDSLPVSPAIPTAPRGPAITFPTAPSPMSAMPAGNAPVALPLPTFTPYAAPAYPGAPATATINLPLDGSVSIVIAVGEHAAVSLSAADVRALRAAAAPLVAELANRGLIAPPEGTLEETP
jgi:DNA-binding transcriptional MerR regulator